MIAKGVSNQTTGGNVMRESFEAGLAQASALFLTFVPRLLLAVAIVAIGYFVGKLICRVLSRVLDRAGFNRLVERGGLKRALDHSGWEAGQILSKVVFYFVMLFVLQLAFGVFGPNPISTILTGIIAFLPNVFVAVVIVVLSAAIASAVKQITQVALGALSYGRILGNAAAVAILVVGIAAALNQLQIAPAIINGLFYALLAAVVGTIIVAVGGGGIAPMRQRWERALGRVEQEAPRIKEATTNVPERSRPRGEVWTDQPGGGFTSPPGSQPAPVTRPGPGSEPPQHP
jgi:hypothetical protein